MIISLGLLGIAMNRVPVSAASRIGGTQSLLEIP